MIPCVVVIKEGVVDTIKVCTDGEHAERVFLDECSTRLSNWDDYDGEDIEAIVEQGYEEYGNDGSICLSWAEEELTVNDDLLKTCVMAKEFIEKMPNNRCVSCDGTGEVDGEICPTCGGLDILATDRDAQLAGLNMAINRAKDSIITDEVNKHGKSPE